MYTRFLWATMQIEELKHCFTREDVLWALDSTPEFLGKLYTNLFNELNEETKPIAIVALHWLAYSFEPLTINLLAEAVVVNPGSSPMLIEEERLVRPYDIVDMLQNLVTVSSSSNSSDLDSGLVHLIHQSLVEFLQDKGLIEEGYAHYLTAEICLEYIVFYANSERRLNSKEDIERFPILLYACKHWMSHTRRWMELRSTRSQNEEGESRLKSRVQQFFSQKLWMDTWLLIFDPEDSTKEPFLPFCSETQPLSYAVSTGIREVVVDFVQRGADINAGNLHGRRPLHNAVTYGLTDIAATLVAYGADPLVKDSDGKMPLLEAAISGHAKITTSLFQHTDIRLLQRLDKSGSTVLHSLAMKAPGFIFSMLMNPRKREGHPQRARFDINHRDQAKRTLLHRAVEAGNMSVITILLAKGSDLNAEDKNKDTPLHIAVRYDQEVAKEILINHGALPTIRNADKKTALELSWAKKSLRWDLYQVDETLTCSTRISVGAQAECHILKKEPSYTGPDVCLKTCCLSLI